MTVVNMAAPRVLTTICLRPFVGHVSARLCSSVSVQDTRKKKVMDFIKKNFKDVDKFMRWKMKWRQWQVGLMNERFYMMEHLHGKSASTACYTLVHNGRVRFHGHQDWIQLGEKAVKVDFLSYKDLPIECVDLSHSDVSTFGLGPIVELEDLRYLNLSCCPYIDDWSLSRLHTLGHSLEVLILAGCPHISERGLASLHHLQNLTYLDISDLPNVSHKGLTKMLLEEVLPACEIVGMDYSEGLDDPTSTPSEVK